jgi:hypothetical protein
LGESKSENIFPAHFKNQKLVTTSQVFYEGNFKTVDTLVYLQTKSAAVKNVKGNVYVYKYKLDNDGPWYLALCGIQPFQSQQIYFNNLISDVKTQLDSTIPLQKQIDKAVTKEVLYYLKNTSSFFGSKSGYYNY